MYQPILQSKNVLAVHCEVEEGGISVGIFACKDRSLKVAKLVVPDDPDVGYEVVLPAFSIGYDVILEKI